MNSASGMARHDDSSRDNRLDNVGLHAMLQVMQRQGGNEAELRQIQDIVRQWQERQEERGM